MKKYIMFCFIGYVGGGQNYVNTKVKYLEKNGWETYVFSPDTSFKHGKTWSPWENLKKFDSFTSVALLYSPEFWRKKTIKKTLDWIIDTINYSSNDEIIIESHTDYWAEWGELLAEKIQAKHFCFLLDEELEKYGAKEFLYFKYLRGEIAGIHITSMKKLFDGYKDIEINDRYVLGAANGGSVSDIDNLDINNIKKLDWNISYIGRDKQYCRNIVNGVAEFSKNHSNKLINFIILGDISDLSVLSDCSNVRITKLGFLTPIPRSFFKKIDVAIAGAGCASISSSEGVPTIVADAKKCLSNGVLGYTVFSSLFSDSDSVSFDEELENVLVKDCLRDLEFKMKHKANVDDLYKEHFNFIESSDHRKEYFNFKKNPQKNYRIKDKYNFIKRQIAEKLYSIRN